MEIRGAQRRGAGRGVTTEVEGERRGDEGGRGGRGAVIHSPGPDEREQSGSERRAKTSQRAEEQVQKTSVESRARAARVDGAGV